LERERRAADARMALQGGGTEGGAGGEVGVEAEGGGDVDVDFEDDGGPGLTFEFKPRR
jgi:hypothetical protein